MDGFDKCYVPRSNNIGNISRSQNEDLKISNAATTSASFLTENIEPPTNLPEIKEIEEINVSTTEMTADLIAG